MGDSKTIFQSIKRSKLTMANPSNVRVNSGPREKMSLNMTDMTKDLMAIDVGMVMTMAADTKRSTQIRPEKCAPASAIFFLKK